MSKKLNIVIPPSYWTRSTRYWWRLNWPAKPTLTLRWYRLLALNDPSSLFATLYWSGPLDSAPSLNDPLGCDHHLRHGHPWADPKYSGHLALLDALNQYWSWWSSPSPLHWY